MRLGMVVPYDLSQEGGVNRHATDLARALRRLGDEVVILGPATRRMDGEGWKTFGGVVTVRANGSDNQAGIFTRPWQVAAFLARQRFDLIHLHEPLTPAISYYVAWFSPRVTRVATFHADLKNEARGLRAARQLWSRSVFPLMRRGIAVSHTAAAHALFPRERMSIIPNGVDGEVFCPNGATPAELTPGAPVRLLFVGAWRDPRKGLPWLLDGFAAARRHVDDLQLDIIGDGGGLARRPSPGVRYRGVTSLDELVEAYRAADIVVAPSLSNESFGLVLLEAMACAKPLICSDIEGYREAAHDDGAVFVPPDDAASLAAAIRALAGDASRRRAMGQANLRHAQAHDWRIIGPRVRAVYEEARADSRAVA